MPAPKSEARTKKILAAAQTEFLANGLRATTMQGIAKRAGVAADVYALGALLYACLAGSGPFAHHKGAVQTLNAVLHDKRGELERSAVHRVRARGLGHFLGLRTNNKRPAILLSRNHPP